MDWYLNIREKQKEFGLPIVSAEYFAIPTTQQFVSATNAPLSKPRVPSAWSSAGVASVNKS